MFISRVRRFDIAIAVNRLLDMMDGRLQDIGLRD